MGTPAFAVPSLHALLALHEVGGRRARVVVVVTQPDRPSGRGGRVQAGPIKEAALTAGVPVLQPERLRRPEGVAALAAYQPDLIVVAAFAQILSRTVLDLPPLGCLNVHASLLPRWRGASPINAAILAGDPETGVTIMRMDPGLDTGPILTQSVEPIRAEDTTAALGERLAQSGADLLASTIGPWVEGTLAPRVQDDDQATLTTLLSRESGRIDWGTMSAATIARMVRAYDPWPGAHTTWDGHGLKLWGAVPLDTSGARAGEAGLDGTRSGTVTPGQVLTPDDAARLLDVAGLRGPHLMVATADGVLLVTRVQPEGKRVMDAADFMRGQPALAGTILGAAGQGKSGERR